MVDSFNLSIGKVEEKSCDRLPGPGAVTAFCFNLSIGKVEELYLQWFAGPAARHPP